MNAQGGSRLEQPKADQPRMRGRRIGGAALFTILLMSTSTAALAQAAGTNAKGPGQAAAEGGSTQLQEVVVTASKRSETLLKAPLAVSAVSATTLQRAGVVNVADLNSIAPNTEVRTVGVDNGLIFSIRGVTSTDYNDVASPAVSTYIDGIFVGRTEGLAGALYDLERVEVLRGPQGTLYGLASTGGNVNFLTASPTHTFAESADVAYGSYNDVQANAMLNVPVTDTLAVRGAFMFHRNDGYYDTEGTTANRYGKAADYAGRLTFLWTPTDKFKWRLSVDDFVSHGTPSLDEPTGPNGKPLNGSPYKQPVSDAIEPSLYVNNMMVRSRMDLTLHEGVTLTYLAGYQDVKDQPQVTLEHPGGIASDPFFRNTPSTTVNQEIDLNVDQGRIHNIFGASYLHQYFLSTGAADFSPPTDVLFLAHGQAYTNTWGAFDQATIDVTDKLKLTGGVRYTNYSFDERNNYYTFCPSTLYPATPLKALLSQQFTLGCFTEAGLDTGSPNGGTVSSSVNYRTGLFYDFSDRTSSYFTVTSGFKAGGINTGATVPTQNFVYQPEQATNYELGVKTRLFDNRVALNTAAFFTTYDNIQITQLVGSGTSVGDLTTNAASAQMYGVELEGQWKVTSNDRVTGFLNYLHATFTDYKNAVDQQTGQTYASLDGHDLAYSPEFSGRLEYSHEMALANNGRVIATGAVYWQTVSYLREFNLPIDKVPAYSKTDLQLQYVSPDNHYTITGYVHNLEDNAVRNGSYAYLGSYLSSYSPPRTFGIRIGFKD